MSLKEVTKPVKDLHDRYYASTPVILRKVGDSLLLVSTSVTAYGITSGQETVALIACISGTAGKILLNFAKE